MKPNLNLRTAAESLTVCLAVIVCWTCCVNCSPIPINKCDFSTFTYDNKTFNLTLVRINRFGRIIIVLFLSCSEVMEGAHLLFVSFDIGLQSGTEATASAWLSSSQLLPSRNVPPNFNERVFTLTLYFRGGLKMGL